MAGTVNLDHGPLGDPRRQRSASTATGNEDVALGLEKQADLVAAAAGLGEGELLDPHLVLEGRDAAVRPGAVAAARGAQTLDPRNKGRRKDGKRLDPRTQGTVQGREVGSRGAGTVKDVKDLRSPGGGGGTSALGRRAKR